MAGDPSAHLSTYMDFDEFLRSLRRRNGHEAILSQQDPQQHNADLANIHQGSARVQETAPQTAPNSPVAARLLNDPGLGGEAANSPSGPITLQAPVEQPAQTEHRSYSAFGESAGFDAPAMRQPTVKPSGAVGSDHIHEGGTIASPIDVPNHRSAASAVAAAAERSEHTWVGPVTPEPAPSAAASPNEAPRTLQSQAASCRRMPLAVRSWRNSASSIKIQVTASPMR
jgi:hypothetical protein